MRIRSLVKTYAEQSFIHPDLIGLRKDDLPEGFNLINQAGVDILTDKVYQLMLKEINE